MGIKIGRIVSDGYSSRQGSLGLRTDKLGRVQQGKGAIAIRAEDRKKGG